MSERNNNNNNVLVPPTINLPFAPHVMGHDSDKYGTEDGSDIDPNEPIGDIDMEIVGLFGSSNGRCCSVHHGCGKHVKVGDLLCLKETLVTVDGMSEHAVKLVKITDGVDGCTVAFIPRLFMQLPKVR
jgi:hypothetical protein